MNRYIATTVDKSERTPILDELFSDYLAHFHPYTEEIRLENLDNLLQLFCNRLTVTSLKHLPPQRGIL